MTPIARLMADLDPETPFTILAFFPAYQMMESQPPVLAQMIEACEAVCARSGWAIAASLPAPLSSGRRL